MVDITDCFTMRKDCFVKSYQSYCSLLSPSQPLVSANYCKISRYPAYRICS